MHESSITQSIIDSVVDVLEREGIDAPVASVRVLVGVSQGLVPESMRMYYDMQSPGTILERSELIVETQRMVAHCDICDIDRELDIPVMFCPECGAVMKLVKGDEITIQAIEVDDD